VVVGAVGVVVVGVVVGVGVGGCHRAKNGG
jgi:hypothetical protein